MKNGNMRTAPASVINESALGPDSLNRIRKTSEFFRKLSLKALNSWHQNSGAKRRVFIKVVNMRASRHRPRVWVGQDVDRCLRRRIGARNEIEHASGWRGQPVRLLIRPGIGALNINREGAIRVLFQGSVAPEHVSVDRI